MQRCTCKHCGRFLLEAHGTVVARVVCPRCKETNDIKKIVFDDQHNLRVKFPEVSNAKQ